MITPGAKGYFERAIFSFHTVDKRNVVASHANDSLDWTEGCLFLIETAVTFLALAGPFNYLAINLKKHTLL